MNVSLTKELESWVEAQVGTGLYRSSSEVVREALRHLMLREQQCQARLRDLHREVRVGLDDLNAGRTEDLTEDLVDAVKSRGRRRLRGEE